MIIGNLLRVVKIPDDLPDDDMHTKKLFELCGGRTFPIVNREAALLEIEVGEVLGESLRSMPFGSNSNASKP